MYKLSSDVCKLPSYMYGLSYMCGLSHDLNPLGLVPKREFWWAAELACHSHTLIALFIFFHLTLVIVVLIGIRILYSASEFMFR